MKVVGKIFAVLFCIIYFFLLTGLMVVSFASDLVSGNYYSSVLQSVDLSTIKIAELGELVDGSQVNSNETVEGVLIDYFTKSGVSQDVALGVINNKKVRAVAGEFIGAYVSYNATGEKPVIDKKLIEEALKEPEVIKLFEASPEKLKMDADKIYENLNKTIDQMVEGSDNNGNTQSNEKPIRINE